MYNIILETPTNYIQYHLTGALFENLYDRAEAALGESFSSVEFHKAVLDLGSVSFEILEEHVDEYIESRTGKRGVSTAAESPFAPLPLKTQQTCHKKTADPPVL